MSAHGRGGLSRLWLGHVAMDVVRQADLPVLLVREHVARRLKQPQEPE
jgi:nucleotide-binding universal stress UspA family protein